MPKHKRNYKDSVFVDLFGEDKNAKANLLSLYNALHGTNLDMNTELKPLRLEQVMYMNFCNDVSCLVDNKIIVLAEHQSTVNENMPLRFLEYAARLYEQIQNPRERYLRRLKKIPTPEFYVFYNGKEKFPLTKTLKLSDAFIVNTPKPSLDLIVNIININNNKKHKILSQCKTLKEYSLFVEIVQKNIEIDKENGFKNAIKECMQNNILKEYLQRKSREVMNMLMAEYDYDTDIAVQRAEEREIAFAEGIEQNKLQTAKLMKQAKCETDLIVQITGLNLKEIERL
ncbi:Rpn family recombination-promoting nuclease/putative transposase [Treponema denticola]|uniref:Transposase (putative) YhgA-like domain-containing protein n=1 Tax=Treponema denticola SP33 TaxID=999437 RepID=M2B568_TREDN|nr:Rpn family recombination-promoting nuclease/putative transposase [Treponema denticola]EMB20007.1 hypothetical protein HMPREF9733_02563 [Treponema denticola SP33]EPF36166.1 hypothetical protein HMPREF9732_01879 [Treponema denticola SP32]